jgi:hypothetical protein
VKKPIVIALAVVAILAASQWLYVSDDPVINQEMSSTDALTLPALQPVTETQSSIPPLPAPAVKSSKKSAMPIDSDAQTKESAARAVAFQEATVTFDSLDNGAKRERRKTALSKIIAGTSVGVEDEVALQQSWERSGRA